MIFTAHINVMPLKDLLDPQGKAVMNGLHHLGINNIHDLRIGKHIVLQIEASSSNQAKEIAEEAAKDRKSTRLNSSHQI